MIYPVGTPLSFDSSRTITVILLDVQTVTSVISACHTPHLFGTFRIQGPLALSGSGDSPYSNISLKENGWRTMKCWLHIGGGALDWALLETEVDITAL